MLSFNWSCSKKKNNESFREIAKDFIQKYIELSNCGFQFISMYYNTDSLISLVLHQNDDHVYWELVGHDQFGKKLTELGIKLKIENLLCKSQPVGKSKILISIHGKAVDNFTQRDIAMTIILKIVSGTPRIVNQVLEMVV